MSLSTENNAHKWILLSVALTTSIRTFEYQFCRFSSKKNTNLLFSNNALPRLRFFLPNDRIIHNLCENSMQVTQKFVGNRISLVPAIEQRKFDKTECSRIVLKQKNSNSFFSWRLSMEFSVLQQIIKSECNCVAIVWRGECLSQKCGKRGDNHISHWTIKPLLIFHCNRNELFSLFVSILLLGLHDWPWNPLFSPATLRQNKDNFWNSCALFQSNGLLSYELVVFRSICHWHGQVHALCLIADQ